jgi:hypothetical protein
MPQDLGWQILATRKLNGDLPWVNEVDGYPGNLENFLLDWSPGKSTA